MADAEMPPPPQRKLNTNADFRKLLETPRVDRGDDALKERKPKKSQATQSGQAKKKPHRPKPEVKKEEDESGYRDRAEERRKGFNPDYERVNADLASLVAGNNTVDPDLNNISVEDSKFLGGDVDHTHLVKGLDYALLQKVRGEMVKEEDDDDGKDTKPQAKARREREVVKFTSAAGRAVFNAVFERPKIRPSELFLPGRTAFVFELDENSSSDIPTTLRRSKADCPPVMDSMLGSVDSSVLERMAKIMSYMRVSAGGKQGRMKKKDKLRMLQAMDSVAVNGSAKPRAAADVAAERPSAPVDAEEDIFGGAGRDFVPEMPKRATDDNDMDVDALPPPPPPPPQLPAADAAVGPARPSAAPGYEAYPEPPPPPPPPQLAAGAKPEDDEDAELDQLAGLAPKGLPAEEPARQEQQQAPSLRRSKEKVKEVIPRDTEDAYEELYPDYQGYSGVLADSDEEDLTHMDGKDGASRYDFETEEQWQAHKASKEMMPKAAFQFGIKAADGRKGQKALVRHREQKESNQLNKIQSLLEKKHGSDYAGAFKEPQAEPAAKAAAKRRRI